MFKPIVQPFLSRRSFASFRTLAAAMSDTSTYKFNHTMLRVKDVSTGFSPATRLVSCAFDLTRLCIQPQRSVKFYEHLGMKMVNKMENPDAKFDLYFMAYDDPKSVSHGKHWSDREGLIELTHNYGNFNPSCSCHNSTNPTRYREGRQLHSQQRQRQGEPRFRPRLYQRRQHPGCLQAYLGCWLQVPEASRRRPHAFHRFCS